MLLSEYDRQKSTKGSILADDLAHQPMEKYQLMKFDFPDKDAMVIKKDETPSLYEGPELGEW